MHPKRKRDVSRGLFDIAAGSFEGVSREFQLDRSCEVFESNYVLEVETASPCPKWQVCLWSLRGVSEGEEDIHSILGASHA